MEWIDNDLTTLPEVRALRLQSSRIPLPISTPFFGRDAFRTGTGVHAGCDHQSEEEGKRVARRPRFTRAFPQECWPQQIIEVGPMCGLSNVIYWLDSKGYPQDEGLAKRSSNWQVDESDTDGRRVDGAARRWREVEVKG